MLPPTPLPKLQPVRPPRATATVLLQVLGLMLSLFASPLLAQPLAWQGLKLQDHRLQTVTSKELAGKPVLMHFVFAGCTSVCPLQVQALLKVHEALPLSAHQQLQFVSVTVDPLSDTPAALAAFAKRQGAERSNWRFVSGAPNQVHRLLDRMQVFDPRINQPQAADHRSSLYLFAADGRLLQRFRGDPVDRVRLADELRRLAAPVPAS